MARTITKLAPGDLIRFKANGVQGVVISVIPPSRVINATSAECVIEWREVIFHTTGFGSHLGGQCVHSESKLELVTKEWMVL